MEELRCPHCNSMEIECDDIFDTEINENGTVVLKCIGTCWECKQEILWDEEYKLSKYKNILKNN